MYDLNNLSIYLDYDGLDDIIIRNYKCVKVTHIGSINLLSFSKSLFYDVLSARKT